jgi:hypothetical protein
VLDLNEVEEIAEPGPMKLALCDAALERARLALARAAESAPLSGVIEASSPKPKRPGEAECNRLHDEGAKQVAVKWGYHVRDEELAELQALLKGGR